MQEQHSLFTQSFSLDHLNEPQRKAVVHKDGPLLVIAGAGSGKTRVITSRIAYLLSHYQIPANQIVALTFTNKAAGEMKERIKHLTTAKLGSLFIGTFHSYCLYLLKVHGHRLGFDTFTILDADDQIQLVSSILKRSGSDKKYSPKQLMHHISSLKNDHDPDHFIDPFVRQVWHAYEQEKKLSKCLDFDDLLLEVLRLFKTDESFREFHQQAVRHLLVDEYQDTNKIQHTLLKYMSLDQNDTFAIDSLCAVGDEDQSVYSWRGATVANILDFKDDFPQTVSVTIDQNYRSVQPILEVANKIIQNNTQRNPKKLWSAKPGADRVRIVQCVSTYQEGELAAHKIKMIRLHKEYQSVAILYRAHYQSRTLEEALIRHSIPYVIIGGIQFYERKEIKDLLAYLKLIVNPFDRVAFSRSINCPQRGLGDVFQEEFLAAWDKQPFLNLHEVAQHLIESNVLQPAKKSALERYLKMLTAVALIKEPQKALEVIIKETAYFDYLKHAFDDEQAQEKIENCKELLRATEHFFQTGITTVQDFLAEVTLMQQKIENDDSQERIQLMTLHAAKGLEFDAVLLTGLEEGIFPSAHSYQRADGIEEERRLLYVGITRARERLLITHVKYRSSFGSTSDQSPSRFLQEIPQHLAQRIDASFWHELQIKQFLSEWFGTKPAVSSVRTFGIAKNLSEKPKEISSSKTKSAAKNVLDALSDTPKTASSQFKLNQPVKHQKFGVGVIKLIEDRGANDIVITALFKNGLKKIKSTFVEPL